LVSEENRASIFRIEQEFLPQLRYLSDYIDGFTSQLPVIFRLSALKTSNFKSHFIISMKTVTQNINIRQACEVMVRNEYYTKHEVPFSENAFSKTAERKVFAVHDRH
jgi:hypothetical protein